MTDQYVISRSRLSKNYVSSFDVIHAKIIFFFRTRTFTSSYDVITDDVIKDTHYLTSLCSNNITNNYIVTTKLFSVVFE